MTAAALVARPALASARARVAIAAQPSHDAATAVPALSVAAAEAEAFAVSHARYRGVPAGIRLRGCGSAAEREHEDGGKTHRPQSAA